MACCLLHISFVIYMGTLCASHRLEMHLSANSSANSSVVVREAGIEDTAWKDLMVMQKVLGRGSFGQVSLYKLREPCKGYVVVKESFRSDDDLDHDIKMHAKLYHENIVRMFDSDGRNHMVLEAAMAGTLVGAYRVILPKAPLFGLMNSDRKAAKGKVLGMALVGLLRGLAFMHGKGYVHRDIKPANIVGVSADGDCVNDMSCRFLVADLGLAKYVGQRGGSNPFSMSAPCGNGCDGTPLWQPPEARGSPSGPFWTYAGDVWALGMSLREMVHPMKKVSAACAKKLRTDAKCRKQQAKAIKGKKHIPKPFKDILTSMVRSRWDKRPAAHEALVLAEESVKSLYRTKIPKAQLTKPGCIEACKKCGQHHLVSRCQVVATKPYVSCFR